MKFGKLLLVCILLVSFPAAAYSQEAGDPDLEESPAPATLFQRTLLADIRTADYYQLLDWCRELRLPETGNADQLRASLLRHYGLVAEPAKTEQQGKTRIVIRSARETEYFKVSEVDENMVQLSGDVLLEVREDDKNRVHSIQADRIMFNQQDQTITAYGNIEYLLNDNGKEETFHGDSLTFSVDNWEGVIFEGDSSRKETLENKEVHFFFSGDRISRNGHNVVIMDNGIITTGSLKDPDFSIRSRKIWVTGIQEWGVLHGVLYMGNVPILYVPFYFKPGNDLFFNPVLGEDLRKGPYVQTTTYLLGHKKNDSSGDFFQIGMEPGSVFELKRIGLYSFKVSKVTEDPKENRLKLMADYYTRLGGYAALEGGFYTLKGVDSLEFQFGLGVTRSLDSSYNMFFAEGDDFISRWNESWLFGQRLPVRYGTSLKVKSGVWSFSWEFYSDPKYFTDFEDRKESFDWLNYIMSDFTSQELEDQAFSRDVSTFSWFVNGSWTPKSIPFSPWVTSFSVSSIKGQVSFDKKTDSVMAAEDSLSPTSQFFYPSKIVLPSIALSVAGTLYSYPVRDNPQGDSIGEDEVIRLEPAPPWSDSVDRDDKVPGQDAESEGSKVSPGSDTDLVPPEKRGVLPLAGEGDPLTVSVAYTFAPNFIAETPTDNAGWSTFNDADWSVKQTSLTLGSRGDISLDLNLFQNLLAVKGGLFLTQNYRTHADIAGSGIDLTESEKTSDYSNTSFEFSQRLTCTSLPIQDVPLLKDSSLSYTLNSVLYRYKFLSYVSGSDPVYTDQWLEWDRDFVSQHQIGGTLVVTPPLVTFSCQFMTDLPPEPKQFTVTPQASLGWRGLTLSANDLITYHFDEQEWDVDNLVINASYKAFDGKMQLSQKILYDLEKSRLQESYSQVDLWFFYLRYKVSYLQTFDWESGALRWVLADKAFVPSELQTGVKFSYVMPPLWKDRLQFSTSVDLSWSVNLVQVNNNVLNFKWNANLNLYRFIDLKWEFQSENSNMYLYFPEWREYFGITEEYDLLTDLVKSFNFFSPDQQDRYDSFFDMKNLSISLIHHLRDWDLTFTYSGYPKRDGDRYVWDASFSLSLQWNPIPSINTRIQYKEEKYYIDSGQSNAQQ